ncbi:MAG TPA: hypothetical protein VJ952_03455 [Opitutales bacterium]|nr:hypothetical protein [Opitutales bacterium]
MNILLAFDKFKDLMPAVRACETAVRGGRRALGEDPTFTLAPSSDERKLEGSSLAGKGAYSLPADAPGVETPVIPYAGGMERAAENIARGRLLKTDFCPIDAAGLPSGGTLVKGPEHLENSPETILS